MSTDPKSAVSKSSSSGNIFTSTINQDNELQMRLLTQRMSNLENVITSMAETIKTIAERQPQVNPTPSEEDVGDDSTVLHLRNVTMRPVGSRRSTFHRPERSVFEASAFVTEARTKPLISAAELPKFDGTAAKASLWLKRYERTASENFYTADLIVKSVSRCLTGDAERWYELEYLPSRCDTTWETFRIMFCEAYISPADRMEIFNRLINRKQRFDESLSAYYREMLQLCLDYDDKMKEEEIIKWVCKNLHPRHASGIVSCLIVDPTLEWLSMLMKRNDSLLLPPADHLQDGHMLEIMDRQPEEII
jgi:hypothetical protein